MELSKTNFVHTSKLHKLKLLEIFADDVLIGNKTFEVRKNDRDFQKGDRVQFICIDTNRHRLTHPINQKSYEITYVLSGWNIKNGYVVFAIKEVYENNIGD